MTSYSVSQKLQGSTLGHVPYLRVKMTSLLVNLAGLWALGYIMAHAFTLAGCQKAVSPPNLDKSLPDR